MRRCLICTVFILALAGAHSANAGLGTPNLTGTWSVTIRGLYFDLATSSVAKRVIAVSTTGTMKITQGDAGKLYVEIDGTKGILDLATPSPDFNGEGYVGNNTWIAVSCGADMTYTQSLWGTADSTGQAMTGDWQITYNSGTTAGTFVLRGNFIAIRTNNTDPGVQPCQ